MDFFEDEIFLCFVVFRGIGLVDFFGLFVVLIFLLEEWEWLIFIKKLFLGGREEKYSDEDVKIWCVVCFDDGMIKCVGCDDYLYCDWCWREMYVGLRVGYDERGY